MPEFLWEIVEEGIERPKEVGTLKWLYYVRPEGILERHVPQVPPEDVPPTKTAENVLVTGYQHR